MMFDDITKFILFDELLHNGNRLFVQCSNQMQTKHFEFQNLILFKHTDVKTQ